MSPDVAAHSFDRPRERRAPTSFHGTTLAGEDVHIVLGALTLLVAIKPSCDGCRDFVQSDLHELAGVRVVVISESAGTAHEWADARQPVIVAPAIVTALDIRWPPFYVLIDPIARRVVCEGVVFAPSQVAREVARFL